MRWQYVIIAILLFAVAASATILAYLIAHKYATEELNAMCSALQIVVLVFTASAGLLALFKYWNSVSARIEQQHWEKLRYLETSYDNFRERNRNIIDALDWPHILRKNYLPLCTKALEYDKSDKEIQSKMFTSEEIARVAELDYFLDYFETLYFAVSRRLLKVEDVLVFLRYYIELLNDAYEDPKDQTLKNYINEYYYNIKN